jgi:hypothetical protein
MRAVYLAFLPILLFAQSQAQPSKGVPVNNAVAGANSAEDSASEKDRSIPKSPPKAAATEKGPASTQQSTHPGPLQEPNEIDPIVRYTRLLVIVGALQLVAMVIQSIFLCLAFRETRASVEVMVNAERAWVTVLPYVWSPEFYPLWEQGDPIPVNPMGMHPVMHQFPAKIKNVGKTPAKIEELAIRYVRIPNLATLKSEPDYGEISLQNGYFLIPNDDEIAMTGILSPNAGMMSKVLAIIRKRLFLDFGRGALFSSQAA